MQRSVAMSEWSDLEQRLQGALRLTRRPVAVAYRDAVPDGVARFAGSEPSSCSFWRLADEGRVFATVPADHYNCPIGSYTQNTPLPAARDVVLFVGRPGRLMLLQEAAMRAGVAAALPLLGRPTCMALPAALTSGVIVSAGCVGNRVYTDVGEDELYAVVPGKDLARLADALDEIAAANATLADYHQQRRQQLASE